MTTTMTVCESCIESVTEDYPMPLANARLCCVTGGYLMADHDCDRLLTDDEIPCSGKYRQLEY